MIESSPRTANRVRMSAPKLPKGVVRVAAFGCTHVPVHDEGAVDWMLGELESFKPDLVVNLGDMHEASSASRWPDEYSWTLEDEYRAADEVRARIRKAAPKAALVELPGNHDQNILDMGRIDPKIRSLCDWRTPQYDKTGALINAELLAHWHVPTEYEYSARGVYRVGQVSFCHGYEHGRSSDENQALLLACPYGLNVSVHTHRPKHVERCRKGAIPLPYWYANAGCLRSLKPDFVKRKRTFDWGHGLALIEADTRCGPSKSLRATRRWEAEIRTRPNGGANAWGGE